MSDPFGLSALITGGMNMLGSAIQNEQANQRQWEANMFNAGQASQNRAFQAQESEFARSFTGQQADMTRGFNAQQAELARTYNSVEAASAREWANTQGAISRDFNASQAEISRNWQDECPPLPTSGPAQTWKLQDLTPYLPRAPVAPPRQAARLDPLELLLEQLRAPEPHPDQVHLEQLPQALQPPELTPPPLQISSATPFNPQSQLRKPKPPSG